MNLLDIAIAKKMSGGGGSEPTIESLSVTENGTYTAPSGVDGYNPITVNVPGITPTGTISITQNGTVDVTQYASANVNVSGGGGGIGTLLHTESLGLIQYSSTTAGSLGKSITVSGVNDYDMLIVEVSADTRQLNSHLCTVSEIILDSNASGYNDYKDFEKTPDVLVCTLNYVIYANGTIASSIRIAASGLCGVYAKTANITSGVATLDFYARYDAFYAETINNEYTARVYGVKLYDLIL